MKEENTVKIVKIGAGCFLATLYAFTGVDGVILIMAAFLFGLPIEELVKHYLKGKE